MRRSGPLLEVAGIELNPSAFLIGLARMVLVGIYMPRRELGNSLERESPSNPSREGFDAVLANPTIGNKASGERSYQHFAIPTRDSVGLFIQHALSQLKHFGIRYWQVRGSRVHVSSLDQGRNLDDICIPRQRTHQIQSGTCSDDQNCRIGRFFADGLHYIKASTAVTEPIRVVREQISVPGTIDGALPGASASRQYLESPHTLVRCSDSSGADIINPW